MIILFVTVGTSAIYNPDIGRAPDGRDNRALRADVEQYRKSADKRLSRFSDLEGRLKNAHKQYWKASYRGDRDRKHLLETSAELVSTVAVFEALHKQVDRVVLLNSATADGRLAADINRIVLGPLVAPAVVSEPEEIEGLEARVVNLLAPLDRIVRKHRTAGNEDVIFNFTGGFKGLIPSITILARRHGWRMFYQHDTLDKPVWIQFSRTEGDEMVESLTP